MEDDKISGLSRLLSSDQNNWDEMKEGKKRLDNLFERLLVEQLSGKSSSEIIDLCYRELSPFEEIVVSVIPEEVPYHYEGSPFFLDEGKIITVDCALRIGCFWADGAYSYGVGELDKIRCHLLNTAKMTFDAAWEGSRPGASFNELCDKLSRLTLSQSCTLVPNCGGHGIGVNLHQESDYIYVRPEEDIVFPIDRAYTVEPVVACEVQGKILSAYYETTRIPLEIT